MVKKMSGRGRKMGHVTALSDSTQNAERVVSIRAKQTGQIGKIEATANLLLLQKWTSVDNAVTVRVESH